MAAIIMRKIKILCLGNEFIKRDSLAKKIGWKLKEQGDFEIININDSFQLMDILKPKSKGNEDFIILDVVKGLMAVIELKVDDLRQDSILTAHDFDAGYVLKLLKKEIKIIGIPMYGDEDKVLREVRWLLKR